MIILRIKETEMVASAAISLVRAEHRGIVVNTTKYGTELHRENARGCGRVAYDFLFMRYKYTFDMLFNLPRNGTE